MTGWENNLQGIRQRFKFDHTNKRYRHEPKSFKEMRYKILEDFVLQTNQLIPARKPDFILINNNNNNNKRKIDRKKELAIPADLRVKI